MRRLALISGMLLTLTAGMWSTALAALDFDWCLHERRAPVAAAPAHDEHDCCRAKLDAPDARHSEPPKHSHESAATHEDAPPQTQTEGSHAGMDCEGADASESNSKAVAAFGDGGRSCFECCAGRANQTPTTATLGAPEQNKVKRAAASAAANVYDSFAPTAPGVSHLAPSQHAPPAPRERRHVLISVFLI